MVQRPDPARRDHHRRDRRPRCRRLSARRARDATSPRSSGCTARATPCCSKYTDPSGHWGPEGRAWVKRLDAETLRVRWLAGVDAPPQEALVEAWREAEQLFDDFGHVHELAAVRAVLAGILRATGDPAGARELGDRAREVAHRLGAQPLLDRLRAQGSAADPRRRPRLATPSPPARPRSWPWSPRAAPTARSASSCSSAPRPSRCTSPTSSASSAPPAAPRPPRSRAGAGCCD